MKLFLLSTDGCHLCEQAKEILAAASISAEVIDIIDSDELVTLYGQHIPVLIGESAEQALFWPFSLEQINEYKEYYGIS